MCNTKHPKAETLPDETKWTLAVRALGNLQKIINGVKLGPLTGQNEIEPLAEQLSKNINMLLAAVRSMKRIKLQIGDIKEPRDLSQLFNMPCPYETAYEAYIDGKKYIEEIKYNRFKKNIPVDWDKVPDGTTVFVRDEPSDTWKERTFHKRIRGTGDKFLCEPSTTLAIIIA